MNLTRRADRKRGLLRHSFPDRGGSSKVQRLLHWNSRRKVVSEKDPCYIKLANSWIILNSGGGPTPDKPDVLLETPHRLERVSSFLNLRVADIGACYSEWKAKGAEFLTEPLDNHGHELRWYMRDPDGYLIEVGEYTQQMIAHFKRSLLAGLT